MNQNNVNVTSNENPAETTLNKVSVITGNESAADRAEKYPNVGAVADYVSTGLAGKFDKSSVKKSFNHGDNIGDAEVFSTRGTAMYIVKQRFEMTENKVTSIDDESDNEDYPSAKAVYDFVSGREKTENKVTAFDPDTVYGNTRYPSFPVMQGYLASSHSAATLEVNYADGTTGVYQLWTEVQ